MINTLLSHDVTWSCLLSSHTRLLLVKMELNKKQKTNFLMKCQLVIVFVISCSAKWCALYRIVQLLVLLDTNLWKFHYILLATAMCVLVLCHGALDQSDVLAPLTRLGLSVNVNMLGYVTLIMWYTGCHIRCHNDHALSQTETLIPCVGGVFMFSV